MVRVVLLVFVCLATGVAAAKPPLEAYGKLPNYRSVSLSPNGDRIVLLGRNGDLDHVSVFDRTAGEYMRSIDVSKVKARSAQFLTSDFAILRASETTRISGFRGELEYSAAFAWDVEAGDIERLLDGGVDLFPAQAGLGRIVGKLDGKDEVFMPAYVGPAYGDPSFDLLRVRLDTGRSRIHARGNHHTIDWLIGANGEVIAREDFNDTADRYSVWYYVDGRPKKIYEEETTIPTISLLGVKPDGKTLLVSVRYDDAERNAIVELSLDGKLSEPVFSREDADVERIIMDVNRVVYGVEYSGLVPSYEFPERDVADPTMMVRDLFPEASISITDWTHDFQQMVFYVAGGETTPAYYIYDDKAKSITRIAQAFDNIPDDELGKVLTINFKARDGESIPSILTLPPGGDLKGNYPTIVLPHGGPQSYDAVGFDWQAQYFANRGYAVIQPNFRGSDGFGAAFEEAGHRGWGRGVMQHDVTDALKALIKSGIADPARVCIIGGSYGGYSALAGGAFTPELYKCVAAFAPVSDLPRMLIDERRDSGKNSWVLNYWEKRIGDLREQRDFLKSISPAEHADAFQAPVLLIHGNDDTVVPFRQSRIMENALQRAGKDVTLLKLKGGDHWHSTSETRLESLKAMSDFVEKHIGGGAAE